MIVYLAKEAEIAVAAGAAVRHSAGKGASEQSDVRGSIAWIWAAVMVVERVVRPGAWLDDANGREMAQGSRASVERWEDSGCMVGM